MSKKGLFQLQFRTRDPKIVMKYVALLSGGKDSCYNLLHCSKNNHVLVAAASLGPEHGKGPHHSLVML
jgi:diphthamide synthase (EF-2-diphthine--ammonia ligase)